MNQCLVKETAMRRLIEHVATQEKQVIPKISHEFYKKLENATVAMVAHSVKHRDQKKRTLRRLFFPPDYFKPIKEI